MPSLLYQALPTDRVRVLQRGGLDAYGFQPEVHISDGVDVPCRHCLTEIPAGEAYLILAYCPFPDLQPYAETGPIFLHQSECARHSDATKLPSMFLGWDRLLMRGYGRDHRIVNGTGKVLPTAQIDQQATFLLAEGRVRYLHLRSASNNCFQARISLLRG